MKLSAKGFRQWKKKAITLLGMSGVGKTRLACMLRRESWFHYSGDYRIGTHYLDLPILDRIKLQAMQNRLLRKLLLTDSICITNNISIDDLEIVSVFLGQLGNPEQGGLGLKEFKRRQLLHHDAEVAAMKDVPDFINRAREVYGYDCFVNDAGGSLCELEDPTVMETLSEHTMILYIQATVDDEKELIQRAIEAPKPLYYREDFLDRQLKCYMKERELDYAALIDPHDFVKWIFPKLFNERIPRYESLAKRYGCTLSTSEIMLVNTAADFLQLIESKLE